VRSDLPHERDERPRTQRPRAGDGATATGPAESARRGAERPRTIMRGLQQSQFLRGIIGDAGAFVTIRTFSGDIVLEKSDKKP
jgi:hypothetical protein